MLACDAAPGCDSFSYNAVQRACFLKRGASRATCRAPAVMCVSARGQAYSCGSWQTYYQNVTGGGGAAASDDGSAELVLPPAAQQASVKLVEAFEAP